MRQLTSFLPSANLIRRARRAIISAVLLAMLAMGVLAAEIAAPPAIVAKCQADLAQRLTVSVQGVTVVSIEQATWADTSLGMPERDAVYAQVQTAGWKIVLQGKNRPYLYTANAHAFRYGGPVSLWSGALLYIMPTPQEPNLNGDLYQCSLLDTNHVRLATGVQEYYPQEQGVILFTRRTSRSSFELYALTAGTTADALLLHKAFAYGAATWHATRNVWAAFVKPGIGQDWQIVVAPVAKDASKRQVLPLPEGVQPEQIAWDGDQLLILVKKGDARVCYRALPYAEQVEWNTVPLYTFPGMNRFMLNKSESLEVAQAGTPEKPVVEVARVWFTGDRNIVATLNGLTLRGYDFVGAGYVLVWGESDGKATAYAVQIATGEVFRAFHGAGQHIKPFQFAPLSSPVGMRLAVQ